jgi:dGTPase
MLASYASDPAQSRGRKYPLADAPSPQAGEGAGLEFRGEYQRDRDRIVHSSAFRRLVYKTQVFLNHEGDLFRTRLTHSLEVAQLGRSIARALALNEDLVEAIALAHDLGHTPFGHAGQDALNDCMRDYGGFEHNLQSLRVVDALELRYPSHPGLNLSFESREGILKHCARRNALLLEQAEPGGLGRRFIDGTQPSLEAQLCNLADEIAYNAHDIDDGVRSGLLSLEQLKEVPLFEGYRQQALQEFPHLALETQGRRVLYESIRRMLSSMVHDVIAATRQRLTQAAPQNANAARQAGVLVVFSEQMGVQSAQLKRFLLQNLYRHPDVMRNTSTAQQMVRTLFACYMQEPSEMGQNPKPGHNEAENARAVADYLAGMTDRFATREHERLTGQKLFTA